MNRSYRDDRDYKKRRFSESTDGRGVSVAATSSPGTLIHQALSSPATNEWDEVHLYAVNNTASPVDVSLQWGGTDTGDRIDFIIPAGSGLETLVQGLVLNNAAAVRAFADTTNAVVIHGFVNRYEQEGM